MGHEHSCSWAVVSASCLQILLQTLHQHAMQNLQICTIIPLHDSPMRASCQLQLRCFCKQWALNSGFSSMVMTDTKLLSQLIVMTDIKSLEAVGMHPPGPSQEADVCPAVGDSLPQRCCLQHALLHSDCPGGYLGDLSTCVHYTSGRMCQWYTCLQCPGGHLGDWCTCLHSTSGRVCQWYTCLECPGGHMCHWYTCLHCTGGHRCHWLACVYSCTTCTIPITPPHDLHCPASTNISGHVR